MLSDANLLGVHPPKVLGLIGNIEKPEINQVLPRYLKRLREIQFPFILEQETAKAIGEPDATTFPADVLAEHCDLVISFGGDGTFLSSAHLVVKHPVPILGVNLGGLGYLAEVSPNELFDRTDALIRGEYKVENRLVLEATVNDSPQVCHALNEVAIDRAGYPRTIMLRTSIDGKYLNTYTADGLILATPTGSTAYSLSTGGPILEPTMGAIILAPISPHTLANRPVVVQDDKVIEVVVTTKHEEVLVTVDGQVSTKHPSGAKVTVKKAKYPMQLVKFPGRYFYDVLREKLKWGD
jgi:NAD+ kinase